MNSFSSSPLRAGVRLPTSPPFPSPAAHHHHCHPLTTPPQFSIGSTPFLNRCPLPSLISPPPLPFLSLRSCFPYSKSRPFLCLSALLPILPPLPPPSGSFKKSPPSLGSKNKFFIVCIFFFFYFGLSFSSALVLGFEGSQQPASRFSMH